MSSACRFCSAPLEVVFADLGSSAAGQLLPHPPAGRSHGAFYPLRALVSERRHLVQLEEFHAPEHIFGDYACFSSYLTSWLDHFRRYTWEMVERDPDTQVADATRLREQLHRLPEVGLQKGLAQTVAWWRDRAG